MITEYRIEILKYINQNKVKEAYVQTCEETLFLDLEVEYKNQVNSIHREIFTRIILQIQSRNTYENLLNMPLVMQSWSTLVGVKYYKIIEN